MSEHKRHEQHKIEDIGDVACDFSNLPDCILHHIMSFMNTTEAVKTSILSTRWKNLWTFSPNIDFDDKLCATPRWRNTGLTSFVNFVEKVLQNVLKIKKFCLSFRVFNNTSQIHSWISHAIMQNVQELDLSFYAIYPYVIPQAMFYSTSLVTLKIKMMSMNTEHASHVSFPCLKTLHLSVEFPNDDFTEKIFSGCSVLEELVLFQCCFMNLKNVTISNSTLKRLKIHDQVLCDETIETLLFGDNIRFLVFRNLNNLELSMEIGIKHMVLLSFCPVLQSICFLEGFMHDKHIGVNNSIWSSIPKCISNCLKTMTLKKFHDVRIVLGLGAGTGVRKVWLWGGMCGYSYRCGIVVWDTGKGGRVSVLGFGYGGQAEAKLYVAMGIGVVVDGVRVGIRCVGIRWSGVCLDIEMG
ncbi:unnamed protein product [Lactuca saligna]|uniref:F-box domain-containing protein n=1 Tax=Lactuca saligna TaxID=75948 RepID=A0AA35ZU53_LACSI|nr:unnamed protein product [Lactuca saligna]